MAKVEIEEDDSMNALRRRLLLIAIPLLIMGLISGGFGLALSQASPPAPRDILAGAFAYARAQDSYHMVADVEQTLIPQATPANIGKRDETSAMRILGDVTRETRVDGVEEQRAQLLFYSGADDAVELILAGNTAYVGYRGRWQVVEDPLGGIAPGGDALGYLVAATDVVETGVLTTAAGRLRRFTFNLDGELYAEYQRQRVEALLAGQMPQGVRLQANPALKEMSGQGELWLDDDGLPRRQLLDVDLPNVSEGYDARMHMTIDFSRFGEPVPPIVVPQVSGSGAGLTLPNSGETAAALDSTAPGQNVVAPVRAKVDSLISSTGQSMAMLWEPVERFAIAGMLALPVLALSLLLVLRRRRVVYLGVAAALMLTMVAQPLLDAGRFVRFFDRSAEAAGFDDALQQIGAQQARQEDWRPYVERWLADMTSQPADGSATDLRDCRSLYVDQGIPPGGDEDGDLLTNEVEWCLGTNYGSPDSDFDGITDTLEVEGFDYNSQTWTTDPLLPDTNGDGMPDDLEWSTTLTGTDFVEFIDWDQDGTPNPWDDDNDGDGVPDGNDISPYASTPYRQRFELTVSGPQEGATIYIDVQMRPLTDHLRYSLTTLDWPSDSQGQIQDLDNSTDDMQLIPVLEVSSQLSPTLREKYGISARNICDSSSNTDQCYSLWVPLQTVESGGNIYAFSARIPFTAEEGQNIIASSPLLTNGRIVWLAQAALDQAVTGCQEGDDNCSCDDSGACVLIQDSIVTSYYEDELKITGLSITQIEDVQIGLFGTSAPETSPDPNAADEDKIMMQLMSAGLAGTFLYTDTAVTELALNFENPDPAPAFTSTWGLDPAVMHWITATYAHRDEALATTNQTTTVEFLNGDYIDCSVDTTGQLTPTLALAYQEISGGKDLLAMIERDTGVILALSASLSEVPMATMHQTQLTTYACEADGASQAEWDALPLVAPKEQAYRSALGEISRRYPSQAQERWMSMVQQLFMNYYFGRTNLVAINGQPVNVAPASEAGFSWLVDYDTASMPDYVRKVYELDAFFQAIDTRGTLDGTRAWSNQLSILAGSFLPGVFVVRYLIPGLLKGIYKIGRWAVMTTRSFFKAPINVGPEADPFFADPSQPLLDDDPELDLFNEMDPESTGELSDLTEEVEDLDTIAEEEAAGSTAGMWSRIIGIGVAVVVTAIIIAIIWIQYNHSGLSGIQKDAAKGQAEAATIIALAQLVLTIILIAIAGTGIGLLIELAIYVLIYVIVGLVTGDWNPASQYGKLMTWLTGKVFKFELLAVIPDDGTGVVSGPLSVTLGSSGGSASAPTNGPMFQTWGYVNTTISTTLTANPDKIKGYGWTNSRKGSADDIAASWAFARWTTIDEPPEYLDSYFADNDPHTLGKDGSASSYCTTTSNGLTKYCQTKQTIMSFKFAGTTISDTNAAGRNTAIPVVNSIETYLRYQSCFWDVIGYTCNVKMNYSNGPDTPEDTDDNTSYFYFDVLPNTLGGLTHWNSYNPVSQTVAADFNADIDNDGLLNTEETADCSNGLPAGASGTCPDVWDSDGDGLSDGWEVMAANAKGTDATLNDSDGDGLSDSHEVRIGTSVTISDTDSDGLTDGEEVCRIENGQAIGGWPVAQASNYRTCSDPLKGDYDNDYLLDSQEKRAGLSPYAPNTAPWMQLTPDPSVRHKGATVSVLKAGDPLTVTLYLNNTTAASIDQPMTLDYATDVLLTMTPLSQEGSDGYVPPTPGTTASGISWNFTPNPLYSVEAMTSTLQSGVDPAVTQSQVTAMQATVVYSDVVIGELKTLSETIAVLVDMDEPATTIKAPADGQAINGTAYTLGGTATDPTSWPAQVEVRVAGDSYDTGWQVASGTETWAWTWTPLPADGVYTVTTRATDYVGNVQSSSTTSTVIVDNTAPGAGFRDYSDGDVLQLSNNIVTLYVTGDDTLSGAPQVAGLRVIQVRIDGRPWTNVSNSEIFSPPFPPILPAGRLRPSYRWTVNDAAYGSHTLSVRAVDSLGQVGQATTIQVIIDTLPPTDIWSNYQANLPAGRAIELLGHADDEGNVPLPARPEKLENVMDAMISATVQLMPAAYTDTVGMTVSWLGDVNGDARADLAVGMPAATVNNHTNAGRVSVVYGQPGGWPVPSDSVALANATTSFAGVNANSQLGQFIAPGGDINADGLGDYLIGDPAQNTVYAVYGNISSLGTNINPDSLSSTQAKGLTVGAGLAGSWQAAAGDVDGDGFDDLLVGVTGLSSAHPAVVYLASGKQIRASSSSIVKLDAAGSVVALETFDMDGNGAVATGVGDVNNDQYGDFVIADPNGRFGSGPAIYLMLGPPTWRQTGETGPLNPLTHANASFPGVTGIGTAVIPMGDVNGDTLPDFAYSENGTPKVVYGRTSGWSLGMSPDVSFTGSTAFDSFIAAPGDVNVDGINDVLLGSTSAGGRAFLIHGRSDLASNQPVQAEIGGVSAAASAPYAAGADLNCDLSSDLLLVPVSQFSTLESLDGVLAVRRQYLNDDRQAAWIGPAPAPRAMHELPAMAIPSISSAVGAGSQDSALSASLTTPALAFRVVTNNIDDWVTGQMMVGDFDGDGKSDVAGWGGSVALKETGQKETSEAEAKIAGEAQAGTSEEAEVEQPADVESTGEALPIEQTDAQSSPVEEKPGGSSEQSEALAGLRMWHSDGYDSTLTFSEYTHNLPASLGDNSALLLADFDGNGSDDVKTDIGYWDDSAWQFLRSDGVITNTTFSFTPVSSNLGNLAAGDTDQVFLGDFDGDGRSDVAAWDVSAWATYLSAAGGDTFDFNLVTNNLGALAGSSASDLVVGDFDGNGMTDVASRASDTANWAVWLSQGLSGGNLSFQQTTATSLGYDLTSDVPWVSADFSGDGRNDVLALFDNAEFVAWLSQASPGTAAAPFRRVLANALQFSGSFPTDTLIGDFDGDDLADYASLDGAGTGWEFQLSDLATTRVVDDDFCASCLNDGYEWGVTAFNTLQSALDASWHSDIILLQPGIYAPAVIAAGQDFLTLRGTDPDAVFLDANGGVGLSLLPTPTTTYPDIKGVTIENLTIRNASTAIKVNFGGQASASPNVESGDNVRVRNVLFYQDLPGSTAIEATASALWVRHNTLVSNAPGVTLVHSKPSFLTENYIFLQDNLFVALPNAAPLPTWWQDDQSQLPGLVSHNGFASENGMPGDWSSSPNGDLMTIQNAEFLNTVAEVFRIGAGSTARSKASDGSDQGYYNYRDPVTVDATFCPPPACENDGLTWGKDAFNSIQDAIASGAQKVLIDPGIYRERISLVNGVSIFGSGAGLTVLAPPDDEGAFLVGVENAKETGLALISITGDDSDITGIKVDGDGLVTVQRAIIRNTGTAISVTGNSALATLVNNTIVSNDNGVKAVQCGNVDIRNSILAYHQDTALGLEGCASTGLHTYNAYWQNEHDLRIDGSPIDQPGPGELFANPRFTDPNHHDYRPLSDSPVVDAGDPSDPAPPGSGERVDLGYAQSVEASVYASKDYCEQCLNDGLEWQVTAFDTIQDAVDNVPDIAGVWTVGVAGGSPAVYHEQIQLKSGIRMVGAGADTTVIDADDTGSALTLNGVTNVEISGFTITDAGDDPTDAGIRVDGASNNITITHNIIGGDSPDTSYPGNGNYGVLFTNGSTGELNFNTIAVNYGTGVVLQDAASWVHARFNVIAFNDAGLDNSQGGQIFNDYNLLYNTDSDWCSTCADYLGTVTAGLGEIVGQDPLFNDLDNGDFRLSLNSPALDGIPAAMYQPVPTGGGTRADMGFEETLATPATLLLGKEGDSCGLGSAGVATVEVGLVYVPDSSVPADQTPPSSWQAASLVTPGEAGSYWTSSVTPASGDGLYRLYSRPTDVVNNVSTETGDLFRASFIADGTTPVVSLISPTDGATSTAPALSLAVDVTDWAPTGVPGETSFSVAGVTFLVDSEVVTVTRAITVASAGQPQRYTAQVALENGTHTVSAVATDLAGNVGQSTTVSVTVVTTQNEASLSDPAPGSAVNEAAVTLEGFVHFQDTQGDGRVEVLIDNASQGMAVLADPAAQATSWTMPVILSGEGNHTITLRASRTAGSSSSADSTTSLVLDTTEPSISFQPPQETVTRTVTLDGSASDETSGLASVFISVDGGHSYQNATADSGGNWTFTWSPDLGNDYAGFPVRVRAMDAAGNATVESATVIVDNLGPTPISLVSVSPQEGSHVVAPSTIQLDWLQVTDGSAVVEIYAAVDQITDTIPSQTQPISGNSYDAQVNEAGTWYVHLLAVDGTGNRTVRHFGPWFAGTGNPGTPGLSPPTWQSSIQVDGNLDIANGEWQREQELLGSDPRPGRVTSLYTTWDSESLFLAWVGPRWGPEGNGYLHLDTLPGGSSIAYGGGGQTLPFEADYVVVSTHGDHMLLVYTGAGQWQEVQDPNFLAAYSAGNATEIRVPRAAVGAYNQVQLHAFVMDEALAIRSVLPDLNPFDGPWTSAYGWPELAYELAPNAGQPEAHHARVTVTTPDGGQHIPGPGSVIDYVFHVTNLDLEPLEQTTLIVEGSEGLRFESLSGWPLPVSGIEEDRWFIDLGTLAPLASEFLTITARVREDLSDTDLVTVAAIIQSSLAAGEPALSQQSLSHPVDSRPPIATIDLPAAGATLRSGLQGISGSAHDLSGGGVARVEIDVDGGGWIEAQGTRGWSAQIDSPADGQFTLSARAIDVYGHVGDADMVEITVDNVAPTATIDPLPSASSGTLLRISGEAIDPFPSGGTIAYVQVQMDSGLWSSVSIPSGAGPDGSITWALSWIPPLEEGVAHVFSARAVDAAGNVGPATEPMAMVVDSVKPSSIIVSPEPGVVLDGNQVLVWGLASDGWGLAQVEASLDGGQRWQPALLGEQARVLLDTLGVTDVPPPDQLPPGTDVWAALIQATAFDLAIRSRATDLAGNVETPGVPVRITRSHFRYWLPLVNM
jgi:hypothetical protein